MKSEKMISGQKVYSEGHGVPMGNLATVISEFNKLNWRLIAMAQCGFQQVTSIANLKPQNIPTFSLVFETVVDDTGIVNYPS
jgi:hypothetical protein